MTDAREPGRGAYRHYVLALLTLTYVLNFVDRQILGILADDVKRDLGLTDADLGFLFGTAFGVFYALFGIPLGRLADGWRRVRLIAIGLSLWSAMTMLSGVARTGGQLALARIGVGVGEATASPCAYSLLSDYFPRRQRATALAIYSSGAFIGGGLSLYAGGTIAEAWNRAHPHGALGLVGWQAAFVAAGLPGLLLACWTATLREPVRGASDGIVAETLPQRPFTGFLAELLVVLPPLTLYGAARRGRRALAINAAAALLAGAGAWGLIRLTGSVSQWAAVGLGGYAVFSWAAALRERDPPTFRLIWDTRAFVLVAVGYGLIAAIAYAVSAFAAPYAGRMLHEGKSAIGLWLGGGGAAGGLLGTVLGGRVADALRERHPCGRLVVIIGAAILPLAPLLIAYTTTSVAAFYLLNFAFQALVSSALGASAATLQDLVLPRMRGAATATFFLSTTLVGLALGPYLAGYVSTTSGSLRAGILAPVAFAPVALLLLLLAWRAVPAAEASLVARARAAGEAAEQPGRFAHHRDRTSRSEP